jgi:hypothetical protein
MTNRPLSKVLALIAAGWVAPVLAEDATPVCINAGHQYQVGDYACLPGCHGRQRYARCDTLGVSTTTWTYISDVCPIAAVLPPLPDSATLTVTTVMTPIPYDITSCAIDPEIEVRLPG